MNSRLCSASRTTIPSRLMLSPFSFCWLGSNCWNTSPYSASLAVWLSCSKWYASTDSTATCRRVALVRVVTTQLLTLSWVCCQVVTRLMSFFALFLVVVIAFASARSVRFLNRPIVPYVVSGFLLCSIWSSDCSYVAYGYRQDMAYTWVYSL